MSFYKQLITLLLGVILSQNATAQLAQNQYLKPVKM